jgi:hypothetical protein
MTNFDSSRPAQNSLPGNFGSGARRILGNRFAMLAIGATVLGLGAYSSWGWLVAAGIAPLLLAFAPCAAMCALGMCTMGGKKRQPAESDGASSTSSQPSAIADKSVGKADKGCC